MGGMTALQAVPAGPQWSPLRHGRDDACLTATKSKATAAMEPARHERDDRPEHTGELDGRNGARPMGGITPCAESAARVIAGAAMEPALSWAG